MAFDPTPPSVRQPQYGRSFLKLACDVLESALCLSRREAVTLRDDWRRRSGDIGGEEEEYAGEEKAALVEEDDRVLSVVVGSTLEIFIGGHRCSSVAFESATTATTAAAAEGAVVHNRYRDSKPTGAAAGSSNGAEKRGSSASAMSTLTVNIATARGLYKDLAAVEARDGDGGNVINGAAAGGAVLLVKALRPGILSLYVTALVRDDEEEDGTVPQGTIRGASRAQQQRQSATDYADHGAARYRRKLCRIRVVVVPSYAIESVALQDLIGHLEECRAWQDPHILLHAQLFQQQNNLPHHTDPNSAAAADAAVGLPKLSPTGRAAAAAPSSSSSSASQNQAAHSRDVQKAWQDILRILANYGSMHLPPAATTGTSM